MSGYDRDARSPRGTAARLAAERLTDESELVNIREYQRQMDAFARNTMDDFARYMDLNEAFHNEGYSRSRKSAMLDRTLRHLTSLPFASPSAMVFARSKLPRGAESS